MPSLRRAWVVALALGTHATILPAQSSSPHAPASALETRTLEAGGERRSYELYVPPAHRQDRPAPLVLVFHAGGGRASGIAPHTGFNRLAEREGFVVAYPQGLNGRWNDGRGYATASHDDVGFVRVLIDTLTRDLNLDRRRVYATGISNGGMFSYRLACELPGTFAALAPVAAAFPAELVQGCERTQPLSVVAFQGTGDPLMPYNGGGSGTRRVLSAEHSVAFWARVDGCSGRPSSGETIDRAADGTRVRHMAYGECQEGRAVELYTIEGGGHTWPGGPPADTRVGRVSREIDASEVIWAFFARHAQSESP